MSTKKEKTESEEIKTYETMTPEELSAAADALLAEDAAGHSDLVTSLMKRVSELQCRARLK